MIEERTHLLTRTQDEAIRAAEAAGHTGSAVDELIAERRAEAAHEDAEADVEPTVRPGQPRRWR